MNKISGSNSNSNSNSNKDKKAQNMINGDQFVIEARGINKSFLNPDGEPLHILRDIDIEVKRGEMVSLLGRSGSGKTTLLHILGLLDDCDSGKVFINGVDVSGLSEDQRCNIRANDIGFVFQFHYLLKELNVLENVMIPAFVVGEKEDVAMTKAEKLIERVGLSHRIKHLPTELSGGERQRVAIARALINNPKILLADEPTGSLDPKTADEVFALIKELCHDHDLSALIVTHSHSLANMLDRKVTLS